jgi:hypothetical protein
LVVHVSGPVTYTVRGGQAAALARGLRLIDGDSVTTGEGGFATLQMADGSIVRVTGNSDLKLDRVKYNVVSKRADTGLGLDKGRVESHVSPQKPTNSRFEVSTPLMAAGVRGTDFGVSVPDEGRAASDVLTGAVAVKVNRGGAEASVPAGMGGAVAQNETSAQVVPLLDPPDLASMQTLQQRPLIDFSFPALPGAAYYRAFIWQAGADDTDTLGNVLSESPRIRFAGLDDGDYVVRVQAVDARGIEGRPTTHALTLKARPEPPVTMAPPDGGSVEGGPRLAWAEVPGALGYRLQLARDQGYADLILDEASVTQTSHESPDLSSATYYWRVATIVRGKDGRPDVGPYGDPRHFTVRKPVASKVELSQDGDKATFAWDGEDGQKYLLQISHDQDFKEVTRAVETDQRQMAISGLEAGAYYLRVQATDPDGFVRDFTKPQKFSIRSFISVGGGQLQSGDGQEIQRP